jgi:hypothetical protein
LSFWIKTVAAIAMQKTDAILANSQGYSLLALCQYEQDLAALLACPPGIRGQAGVTGLGVANDKDHDADIGRWQ